jgi:hypothetical protein
LRRCFNPYIKVFAALKKESYTLRFLAMVADALNTSTHEPLQAGVNGVFNIFGCGAFVLFHIGNDGFAMGASSRVIIFLLSSHMVTFMALSPFVCAGCPAGIVNT